MLVLHHRTLGLWLQAKQIWQYCKIMILSSDSLKIMSPNLRNSLYGLWDKYSIHAMVVFHVNLLSLAELPYLFKYNVNYYIEKNSWAHSLHLCANTFTGFHTGFFLEGEICLRSAWKHDVLKCAFLYWNFSNSLVKHLNFGAFFATSIVLQS